jgi:RNA binding exosome subunit
MRIYASTAQQAISHLVWNYAAGDVLEIMPETVTEDTITGTVTTRKQYGHGHYKYTIDLDRKRVAMRGHVAYFQHDDAISVGGSVRIG